MRRTRRRTRRRVNRSYSHHRRNQYKNHKGRANRKNNHYADKKGKSGWSNSNNKKNSSVNRDCKNRSRGSSPSSSRSRSGGSRRGGGRRRSSRGTGVRQHVPNLITIARLAALPFATSALLQGDRARTLAIVGFIALSDWLDGFLARLWKVESAFGSVIDPLADKLTQLVLLALLAFGGRAEFGSIPGWLAGLVFARELFLVYGALRIRGHKGVVKIKALWAGKVSTVLVFALLLVALIHAPQDWINGIAWLTAPIVVLSAVQYARAGAQQVR